jgi:MFS family permease
MTTLNPPVSTRSGTLAAFASRNFRLYFGGQLISLSGTWMQSVAQGYLVFQLTQSELWLGIVACAAGLPSLLLSPLGGVLLDRLPRRTILICTQAAQMLLAFILAALTFSGTVQSWHIMLLAFGLGITNAADAPARQAFVADLVGSKERLNSGIALNAMMFNTARVIGPTLAGFALNQWGPAICFLLNGLSFLGVLGSLFLIHVERFRPPVEQFAPLRQLRDGIQYARRHPTIRPLLLLAVTAALLTSNIVTLLPAFADRVLGSPEEGYAAMGAAIGAGAVVATLLTTRLGKRYGRGRVVLTMIILSMLSELFISRVHVLPVALPLAVVYGFAIILQFVTINTMIQSEVQPEFRGRVLSLYTLVWFGISPFGSLLMGWVAEHIGTPDTLLVCALGGGLVSLLIYRRNPALLRLR